METLQQIKDYVEQAGYDSVVLFEEPHYAPAFCGVSMDGRAVYDLDAMVQFLVDTEHMSHADALDFICYNDSYSQGDCPIIVTFTSEEDK